MWWKLPIIKETSSSRTDKKLTTFNTKSQIRVGNWNVRTMVDPTALAQITQKMKGYKLDILDLRETLCNVTGKMLKNEGCTLGNYCMNIKYHLVSV